MSDVDSCPDLDQLRKFAIGELSPDACQKLNQHLLECAECQTRTQSLNTSDTLLDLLRHANRQRLSPFPPALERVIAAVRDRTKAEVLSGDRFDTQSTEAGDDIDGPTSRSTSIEDELTELLARIKPAETSEELGRFGEFRLLKVLGFGGMGIVFLAEDLRLNRSVALKLGRTQVHGRKELEERFLREARASAKIRHDNVVNIYMAGERDEIPFLVHEFLEGETLEARLARQGRLPVLKSLEIARQIAIGLAAAHSRGLVHRDIKPANVFLARDPEDLTLPMKVKLLDFGLARPVSDDVPLTKSGVIIGTPAFMSPEQASGESFDHRTDLFSLGCVLYLMLTGERPFHGKNLMKVLSSLATHTPPAVDMLRPDVPADVSTLVRNLLAKSPDDRPENANEVATQLARLKQSQASLASESRPATENAVSIVSTNRSAAVLLGASAVVGLIVIGLMVSGRDWMRPRNGAGNLSQPLTANQSQTSDANSIPGTKVNNVISAIQERKTSPPIDGSMTSREEPVSRPLADHPLPYVILRDGMMIGEYAFFPFQPSDWNEGDVIEVRGNGPFELPQVVTGRGFHLRAAPGYHPVFLVDESVPNDQIWIIAHEGALRLEGCEFRRLKYNQSHAIGASGNSMEIVDCTIVQPESNSGSLIDCRCPTVRIQDSLMISGFGHVACRFSAEVRDFSMENSLFLSGSYGAFDIAQSDAIRTYRFEHNTIVTVGSVLAGNILKLDAPPAGNPLRVIAHDNLFPRECEMFARFRDAQWTADDYRTRMNWEGEGNVSPNFRDQSFVDELAGPGKAGLRSVPNLHVEGDLPWAPGVTTDKRIDVIRRLVSREPNDGSVGINWNVIGPGAGYLQTLSSTDRQRQQPEPLLSGGPFTLIHDGVVLRGFTSLSAAVVASQDGDTIELRSNQPLTAYLEPGVPGRRLTICAAPGYQPEFVDTSDLKLGSGHVWDFVNLTFRGSLGYISEGQIRGLRNCTFDIEESPRPGSYFGLQIPGRASQGPDVEIVNCLLPGLTQIDAGPNRKTVFRNSILQSCQMGIPWSVDGDHHVTFEDCVIWNPTERMIVTAYGGQPKGRFIATVGRCLFDGCNLSGAPRQQFVWSGDRNQFRLWRDLWFEEGSLESHVIGLAAWQKRWDSDAHSTVAASAYFDPQQWRLLSPSNTVRNTGVDFSRFHRPQALR